MHLKLPIPPSANHMYHIVRVRGRPVLAKQDRYKNWEKECLLHLRNEKRIDGPVQIRIIVPDDAKRDLDNYSKCTLDILKKTVISDDRWAVVKEIHLAWSDLINEMEIWIRPWEREYATGRENQTS